MIKVAEEQPEPPAQSDVKMTLQLTTKVDITATTQPLWVTTNAFVYVSGCSIIKYDLRGPECSIVPRADCQGTIRVLTEFHDEKEDSSETQFAFIYSSLNQPAVLVVRSGDASRPNIIVTELPIERERVIKGLALLNHNKHVAVLSQPATGPQELSVYKTDRRGTEIISDRWSQNVRFLLPGILEGSLLTVDDRGLSMHSYCSLAIETDMIEPYPISSHVYAARVHLNQLVLLVTKQQILFCWPEQKQFQVKSISLKFDILETDQVGAAAIQQNMVVIALSKQRLLAVQFNKQDLNYSTKIWVDTGLVGARVEMLAVSHLCQNMLLLCRNQEHGQRSLEVFGYEVSGLATRKKVRASKLPMDCEGYRSLGITVSSLKEQAWRLTNRSVSIYPHLNMPLDKPTCVAVDPLGLFVVIGFEFYFSIFAVRRQGLLMLHSSPMLHARQVSYLCRLPLILIMCRSEFRLHHSYTYEQVWQEQTITTYSEFLMFQVNQKNCQVTFLLSCGECFIYDLILREKVHRMQLHDRPTLFESDWLANQLVYPCQRVLHIVEVASSDQHTVTLSLRATSLRLCGELSVMFIGFEEGSIGAYHWPINPANPQPITISKLLEQPVVHLQLSANRSQLYASSRNGNFCRLALTFYQNEREVCKDTMISILRCHGVGFSTYYLNNIAVEVVQRLSSTDNEIEVLQFEHQGKLICYEQQVEEAQAKLQEEEMARKIKHRKQRNGVLVQHRNVLRSSKRQFKRLQKKLDKIEKKQQQPRHEERYQLLVRANQRLQGELAQLRKVCDNEKTELMTHNREQLDKEMDRNNAELKKRQHLYQMAASDNNSWESLTQVILEEEYDSSSIQRLEETNAQLAELTKETDYLRMKVAAFQEQLRKLQGMEAGQKQLQCELMEGVKDANSTSQAKQEQINKLEQQHGELEKVLEEQASIEKNFESNTFQVGVVIEGLMDRAQELEYFKMRKLQDVLRLLSHQVEVLRVYLSSEASAAIKYKQCIEQSQLLKEQLKNTLNDKQQCLRMAKYRLNQLPRSIEQAKQGIFQTKRHRRNVTRQLIPDRQDTNKEGMVSQLFYRASNGKKGLEHISRSMNTSVRLHIKQSEGLLSDLNELAVVHHKMSCLAREKAQLAHLAKQNLKGHLVLNPITNSPHPKRLTPFQQYHLNKTSTGKLRQSQQRASLRTSNSTNSGFEAGICSGIRTAITSQYEPC